MTPAIDAMVRAELAAFALELARVAGMVVVTPFLWQQVPKTVRAVLVLWLSVVSHGAGGVTHELIATFEWIVFGVVAEFAVGATIGFVARLSIAAMEIAASMIAPQMGLGAAHIFDPLSGASDTVLSTILRTLAVWIALIVGLHRVLISSVIASFTALPAGSALSPSLAAPGILAMSGVAITTGVRLALPVVAVLFMVQLALAFISRAAPQMQIFSVGFAALLVTGGIVLMMALPDFSRELLADFSHVPDRLDTVLLLVSGR